MTAGTGVARGCQESAGYGLQKPPGQMPHTRVLPPTAVTPAPLAGRVGELPARTTLARLPAWAGASPGVGEPCWGAGGGPLLPPALARLGLSSPIGRHMVLTPLQVRGHRPLWLPHKGHAASLWVSALAEGALLHLPIAGGAWWSSAGLGGSRGQASPPAPPNPGEKPHFPPPHGEEAAACRNCQHRVPVPPGSANTSLGEGRAQAGMAPGTWLPTAASVLGRRCHCSCPCLTREAYPPAVMPTQCCRAAEGTWRAPRSARRPSGSMGAAAPGPVLLEGG